MVKSVARASALEEEQQTSKVTVSMLLLALLYSRAGCEINFWGLKVVMGPPTKTRIWCIFAKIHIFELSFNSNKIHIKRCRIER